MIALLRTDPPDTVSNHILLANLFLEIASKAFLFSDCNFMANLLLEIGPSTCFFSDHNFIANLLL